MKNVNIHTELDELVVEVWAEVVAWLVVEADEVVAAEVVAAEVAADVAADAESVALAVLAVAGSGAAPITAPS